MSVTNHPTVRIRSILLIVGGVAGLIGGATHGDLPEDSGAAALQFVTDHPAYALVHLISILGAVLWALGLAGGPAHPSTQTGDWLARAAGHVALIGAAVLAVQFSLDGIGMEAMAALWSEPDAPKGMFEAIAEIAPEALVGTALTWVVLLYGLTPILAGSSLILATRSTIGWTGLLLGAFSLIGGLALALRVEILPDWVVFAGSTIGVNLWIIALGVLVLRRGAGSHPSSVDSVAHRHTGHAARGPDWPPWPGG